MTTPKRLFDVALALVLLILALPIIGIIAIVILILDGRPALYFAERMASPERAFGMLKFRTMTPVNEDTGVTGGEKFDRITAFGQILRRTHLDELPQIWNVLRGDMSFVGPRPPLRRYVRRHPGLYGKILRSRPGITGLSTLLCAPREARLLARSRTSAQSEDIYMRDCVPVKAHLDLIYQKNRSFGWDLMLLWQTISGGRTKKTRHLSSAAQSNLKPSKTLKTTSNSQVIG